MHIPVTTSERTRVLFFGMECDFSLPALQALLQSQVEVCAVVIPQAGSLVSGIHISAPIMPKLPPRLARGVLPMHTATAVPSIVQMAWQRHIPVWQVRKLNAPETQAILAAYHPDVICVACFSAFIPQKILLLPRLGCLNVHPSLLPENRGPVPLFWTFRAGHETTGVTIHLMTTKMDGGAILAQEAFPIPEGIRYADLEAQCAQRGAHLLVQTVQDLVSGQAKPKSQDEAQSSYHAYPTDDEYVANAQQWGARHLYNFIRGVASVEQPVEVLVNNQYFLASDAISYSLCDVPTDRAALQPDNPGEATIWCQDGSVSVSLKE